MNFNPKPDFSLEALLRRLKADEASKLTALTPTVRNSLKSHSDAVSECVAISIIFFHGFREIHDNGPLRGKVSSVARDWVDTVPTCRSGTRIAGMIASNVCSVLEGFIVDVGPAKLTTTRLAAIRAVEPELDPSDEKARAALLKRVRPSVKANGSKWTRSLDKVFAVAVTGAEEATLVDLIAFRNNYVHDPATAFSLNITGEQLKGWIVAVLILCHRIAVS